MGLPSVKLNEWKRFTPSYIHNEISKQQEKDKALKASWKKEIKNYLQKK